MTTSSSTPMPTEATHALEIETANLALLKAAATLDSYAARLRDIATTGTIDQIWNSVGGLATGLKVDAEMISERLGGDAYHLSCNRTRLNIQECLDEMYRLQAEEDQARAKSVARAKAIA